MKKRLHKHLDEKNFVKVYLADNAGFNLIIEESFKNTNQQSNYENIEIFTDCNIVHCFIRVM